MYQFEDTTTKKYLEDAQLPVSAMNYDGCWLEEAIPGYRTLAVTGREMLSVELQTDSAQLGERITTQRVAARTLKITYQLRNDNPEMLLVNFRQMMERLYREKDVPIVFNDEKDVIYYGRFSASDEVPGDSYMFTSSFEIFCSNPQKYSQQLFETSGPLLNRFPYKTKPEQILVTLDKKAPLEITNGQQILRLSNGNLFAGDEVRFDFTAGKVWVNEGDRTNWLDLTSDFENFELQQNQTITCSNGTLNVLYREVSL